jgi:hypothetical protein
MTSRSVLAQDPEAARWLRSMGSCCSSPADSQASSPQATFRPPPGATISSPPGATYRPHAGEAEALRAAAERGDVAQLARLLPTQHLNSTDADGLTALHLASREGHAQAVQLLCSAGAAHIPTVPEGWTPLEVGKQVVPGGPAATISWVQTRVLFATSKGQGLVYCLCLFSSPLSMDGQERWRCCWWTAGQMWRQLTARGTPRFTKP